VEDPLGTGGGDGGEDGGLVADVGGESPDAGVQADARPRPSRRAARDGDVVSRIGAEAREVRPDEARAAEDQDAHRGFTPA
jgi:hypothetical protein